MAVEQVTPMQVAQPMAQPVAAAQPKDAQLQAVQWPQGDAPTVDFVLDLQKRLLQASWHSAGTQATHQVLPAAALHQLLRKATRILDREPTLLELQPSISQQRVTVVGDTHGQYHDVCNMFEKFGHPSADRIYIFNGDYVDRGSWGVETLALLLAWKWALPHNVYLLRGNHESSFCTKFYGFSNEVLAKYGRAGQALYKEMKSLFACLPLAALVEGSTLILHGGLFRAPPKKDKKDKKDRAHPRPKTLLDVDDTSLSLGTLDDLRAAGKGGLDPDPERSLNQLVASDVMWSDPSPHGLHRPNELRGVGMVFGPAVTEEFLSHNKVRLIIRSHEGPDARHKRVVRERMPSVESGYSVDHEGPSGRLVTLFSAPDYPQFMSEGEERYRNRGAVVHLEPPGYTSPAVESFEAVLPRPQAVPYYDMLAMATSEDSDAMSEEEHSSMGSPRAVDSSRHASAGGQHHSSSNTAHAGVQQEVSDDGPSDGGAAAHTAKRCRKHGCVDQG